ncbi:MAG TPA: hypothetical protein VEB22_03670 [Phycisphaerales bacterium]|nr:hypothetical protein [Phycisphaerales bacterium]
MKHRIVASILLAFSLVIATGCSTTSTTNGGGLVAALGPTIVEVAQTRIALRMLDKNPGAEAKLQKVSAALAIISSEANGQEITAAVIRGFVARRALEWELTPAEEQLLTLGLLAARDAFLANTGAGVVIVGDQRVGLWLSAIQRGIDAGIAEHKRRSA